MKVGQFDWLEYSVFGGMLMMSALIGVFFCCNHGGQHTVSEYYLGNKKMKLFPVAMSLVASFVSGITMLGVPSEIYSHGIQIIFGNLADLVIFLVNITTFQPVFYNLQLISLYEYLEMRFDHRVRVLASALFAISWILYMPIVIYGPSLAFNQVSGLSLYVVAPLVCLVCMFYTAVGGLKAVVWADALQASVMIFGLITVLVTGLSKVGGVSAVISAATEGERLDPFDMDPDPRSRMTFWSSSVGYIFLWLCDATSPVAVQRYISLPSLQLARRATFILLVGVVSIKLLSLSLGLIIYTTYRLCDPLSAKMIERRDQILPYFLIDVAGHLRGVPGLFVSGIFCASLSTLSTGMNTLSGTIYEDFIEPVIGKKSERTASNIMKFIAVLLGVICTALVSVVEKLGNILDIGAALGGVTGGCIFGIFCLGVLMPKTNSKGAFYGGLVSALTMLWTMLGHELSGTTKCYSNKPISTEGCSAFNLTNVLPVPDEVCEEVSESFQMFFPLYRVTHFYYGLMGMSLTIIVGIIVSYMTGFNQVDQVKPELLAPWIRSSPLKADKTYMPVSLGDVKKPEGK